MTSESTRGSNTVLKTLVVLTIVLVAYWSANGGWGAIETGSTTTVVVDTTDGPVGTATTTTSTSTSTSTTTFAPGTTAGG